MLDQKVVRALPANSASKSSSVIFSIVAALEMPVLATRTSRQPPTIFSILEANLGVRQVGRYGFGPPACCFDLVDDRPRFDGVAAMMDENLRASLDERRSGGVPEADQCKTICGRRT